MPVAIGGLRDRADEWRFRVKNRPGGRAFRGSVPTTAAIDGAIQEGSAFLSRHQDADGALCGFLLMPGASTSWITAHVAFLVEDVPELQTMRRRAGAHLEAIGATDGGWAWNRRARIDIDSTAFALLVLHGLDIGFDAQILNRIVTSQSASGGFPTFAATTPMRGYGWQAPHPEVTAVVLELLRRLGVAGAVPMRARRWLQRQLVDGLLPSYWWEGWPYGLFVQARTDSLTEAAILRARLLLSMVRMIPDLPMVMTAAIADDRLDAAAFATALLRILREQRDDGSWQCCRTLRVTNPGWVKATVFAPGRSYRDRRRVFSTAHAVAALHAARRLIGMRSVRV